MPSSPGSTDPAPAARHHPGALAAFSHLDGPPARLRHSALPSHPPDDARDGDDRRIRAELWLVRHGPTEWSTQGKHTSTTDLPLLPEGEQDAIDLGPRLASADFDLVLTSPRLRARRTAELAGFADAEVDDDLAEWGYGDYEGRTTLEIRESVPGWSIWTDPSPGGESADEVGVRLDRVIARARAIEGRSVVFAHGHSLRVLAARWLDLPVADGRHFRLDTATISVLGFERENPVVIRWNS